MIHGELSSVLPPCFTLIIPFSYVDMDTGIAIINFDYLVKKAGSPLPRLTVILVPG